MQRITISIDEPLAATLDRVALERGYTSRSEAVRDLVREGIERWRTETTDGRYCVVNLSYVVDRRVRDLPRRLAEMQHAHHDLVLSSMIVRLDHHNSLETVILKGETAAVRAFAERIRSERGVRLSAVNMLEVLPTNQHGHENDHDHHDLQHLSPAS